jgi:parvulin-like peptidyl-prolyl isomerase
MRRNGLGRGCDAGADGSLHEGLSKKSDKQELQVAEQQKISGRTIALVITLYSIVVFTLVGYPYYTTYVFPWSQPVLQVGDKVFSMRYVIKRLRILPGGIGVHGEASSIKLLQEIQNEELMRREAIRRGISIPDEEVADEVRARVMKAAQGQGEYGQLYEAMLRDLQLEGEEFFEIVRSDLLRERLLRSFMEQLPAVANQVHVYAIVASTAERAEEIRGRLARGDQFSRVARSESIDLRSARRGGDLGWIAKGLWELSAIGQVHARGILVKTKEEADLIREKILAGENFALLARQYSLDDRSRARAGYLGWISTDFKRGRQFAAQCYNLRAGELSEPIDTAEGFWVIRLIEKSPEGDVFDDFVFNQPIGKITPPLYTREGYYLFMVAERQKKRPLNENQRLSLSQRMMERWLRETSQRGSEEGWIKWNWGSDSLNWALRNLN